MSKYDEEKSTDPNPQQAQEVRSDSHLVYELKQQREYYIRKLMDIQRAIDAVNRIHY